MVEKNDYSGEEFYSELFNSAKDVKANVSAKVVQSKGTDDFSFEKNSQIFEHDDTPPGSPDRRVSAKEDNSEIQKGSRRTNSGQL